MGFSLEMSTQIKCQISPSASLFTGDSVLQLAVCGAATASCYLHLRGTNSGRISREIDFERDSYAQQSRNFKNANGGAGAEIFFAPNQWTIRAAPLPPIRACTDAP
jgi:hypothetical protein